MTALARPNISPDDLHRAMLASSPAYFAAHTLIGDPDPPYNGRFLIGKHHLEWDTLATGGRKVCVMAARGIGKSVFFANALPLFYAYNQPGKSTFILGATQSAAQRIMSLIVWQLENNPKLAHLVPARRVRWTMRAVRLANGHEIICAGMGTKMRGYHPNNIIGDDLLTDESAYSETVREKTVSFFFSAIVPMLTTTGTMVVVGTPQSSRDLLMGHLRVNPAYDFRSYPALNKEGEPLWPEHMSKQFLEERRAELLSIRFAREYMCQPVSSASSLFPHDLFRGEPVEQPGVTLGMPRDHWLKSGMRLYVGVDIAMSSGVGADYTVVCTVAQDAHGNTWLVDLQRVRGMPYHEQLALIESVGRKYQPVVIAVESNQAQRFVADELIRTTNLPVVRHTTTAAKHGLENGLPGLKLLFENRKLRLPRGDAHSIEMTDLLAEEFNGFTFINGKVMSVGEHDDLPMAFWIAHQAISRQTFSVSFGPDVLLTPQNPNPEPVRHVDPNAPPRVPGPGGPAFDAFGMGPRR